MNKLRNRQRLAYEWVPSSAGRVLDIGCGDGLFAGHLLEKSQEVYGVDVLEWLVESAKKSYPQAKFELAPAEKTPFADEFFDVITCLDVLEHVSDQQKATDEICRTLRKGGHLIISVPHQGLFAFLDPDNIFFHPLSKVRRMFMKKPTDWVPLKWHKHYRISDLERLFDGRFRIERVYRGGLLLLPFGFWLAKLFGDALKGYLPDLVSKILLFDAIAWVGEKLVDLDYNVSYGPLGYLLIIDAIKV